jgi:hypothetical protein
MRGILHKSFIFNHLRPAARPGCRNPLIFNDLRHRSLSLVSSNFSHAARYIFAKPSRLRRDARSAQRLKTHDKRNKFFLAIRLNVIILFFFVVKHNGKDQRGKDY